MKKELFISLIKKAKSLSSMYTLADIVNNACEELDVRGISHRGFFAAITDLQSFYDANLSLIDLKTATSLFDNENWPIYTRTNDSCPTQYFETADVKNSVVSNGCLIEGSIEHSVIGRGCVIKKGAVVRNSIVLPGTYISEDTTLRSSMQRKSSPILRNRDISAGKTLYKSNKLSGNSILFPDSFYYPRYPVKNGNLRSFLPFSHTNVYLLSPYVYLWPYTYHRL